MAEFKVNQLRLMAVICKEICEQQQPLSVPAQNELMNTCIAAANLVKTRLDGTTYEPTDRE